MEEKSASYERVHLYIQPNFLCKESAEYIARVVMTVVEKLYTWCHHTSGNPGNVFL